MTVGTVHPPRRLFDRNVFRNAEDAVTFIETVLEASTEYSIIGLDLEGSIVLWNLGARRLYGYDADEVIGRSCAMLHTDAAIRDGIVDKILACAIRDGKWEGTVERRRKDGSAFEARVVVTPRQGPNGRPIGFLLVSSDVSEERRAEAKFRDLLESAPDAMVIVDKTGAIVIANAQTEQMFGYSREELAGKPVELLIPDRYHARHPGHRHGFFRAPRARPMGAGLALRAIRKDGAEFPVEISLSPLETEDGVLATAAIRDVTERKRAEGKFRGLLESAPDAMVIVDKTGSVVLANAQTEEMFGYSRDELVGQPVEILIPTRYHGRHPEHRGNFFHAPRARPMGAGLDLRAVRKNGTEFPVEISLSPLETEDGVLATAAIRDVTERRRFESQLQETNVQLETANQAKDRFLASMSHELRTPLNAILGFTGTMLMGLSGPLTDDQQRQLETVQANGKHLLAIINDLLDVAKIESGKVELRFERVDCRALVEDVVSGLRPLADEKGIALQARVPVDEVVFETDRRSLNQILINLTNNAIKFTDKGVVRVELEVRDDGQGQLTRFRVIDTGIGIKPADQDKLFAAFQQAEPSATRRYEGTGLGLYISRRLAQLIGAEISFESELGTGSVFLLDLGRRD